MAQTTPQPECFRHQTIREFWERTPVLQDHCLLSDFIMHVEFIRLTPESEAECEAMLGNLAAEMIRDLPVIPAAIRNRYR